MSKQFSIKFDGKEVKNPVLRFGLLVLLLVTAIAFFAVIPVILTGVGIIILGVPLIIALLIVPHFILRTAGRRGFFKTTHDSVKNETLFEVIISSKSFNKIS